MDVTCDVMIIISRTNGHLWDEQWLGHINTGWQLCCYYETLVVLLSPHWFFSTFGDWLQAAAARNRSPRGWRRCMLVSVRQPIYKQSQLDFVQSFHQRVHLVFDGSQVIETTSRFLEAFSKFCFKSLRFWKFDVTFCVWRQATNFTFFKVNFCIITNRLHVIDPLLVGCKQTNFVLLP